MGLSTLCPFKPVSFKPARLFKLNFNLHQIQKIDDEKTILNAKSFIAD